MHKTLQLVKPTQSDHSGHVAIGLQVDGRIKLKWALQEQAFYFVDSV